MTLGVKVRMEIFVILKGGADFGRRRRWTKIGDLKAQDDSVEGAGNEVGGSGHGMSGEKSFTSGMEKQASNETSLRNTDYDLTGDSRLID